MWGQYRENTHIDILQLAGNESEVEELLLVQLSQILGIVLLEKRG